MNINIDGSVTSNGDMGAALVEAELKGGKGFGSLCLCLLFSLIGASIISFTKSFVYIPHVLKVAHRSVFGWYYPCMVAW